MNLAYTLNTAWRWKCEREKSAYLRATSRVAEAQAAVLKDIVRRNARSAFGREFGFDNIHSPREFQRRVPVTDYEDYHRFVDRIEIGETNVLTCDPVRLLEPTSGTTRGEKLIPYTNSLKRQFQRAVAVWIADLFQQRPNVRRGRAYWSISPALGPARRSTGGIPIGFEDDTEYLGVVEKQMARQLMAVPATVTTCADIDNFRYATLMHLLLAEDLALISVWSPTFLSALLRCIEPWADRFCFDLQNDSLSLPGSPTDGRRARRPPLSRRYGSRRANHLDSVLKSTSSLPEKLARLWPQLALISCWADAAAAAYIPEVRGLFPSVEIQPKGLLATEGCVSIPLVGKPGAGLAVRSHFFEFKAADEAAVDSLESNHLQLAHELQVGGRYQVLLTTAGGIYRYRLHDVVEVVGFMNQCALLRFVGKSNLVSDLVGEKLGESHVREVLHRVLADHGLKVRFSMLVPRAGQPPRYRLYLQAIGLHAAMTESIRSAVQAGLEQNPYYQNAVKLRQLATLEVLALDANGEPASLIYERACIARGQKAGDIKYNALDTGPEWAELFQHCNAGL